MERVLVTSRSFGEVSGEPERVLREAFLEVEKLRGPYDERHFRERLSGCSALIIGAHPFTEDALRAAPGLRIVCKHGAGLDNLDLELMTRFGVTLTNAPGANAGAVADLTLGLMLDVARRISFAASSVRGGEWKRVIGVDVHGKTLGLIGFGAIARCVASRAHGFGMSILANDPYLCGSPEGYPYVTLATMDEVLASCDFLSVHVPLNVSTRGLVGPAAIARMKRGSFLINTSRGGVLDEDALLRALQSGHIAGAALDVLAEESADSPLAALDNVIVTPHMGMYSTEAIEVVSLTCARNVVAALRGGELTNVIVRGKDLPESTTCKNCTPVLS